MNNAPERMVKHFELTKEERLSKFWGALMEHWEQKLQYARVQLETCEDEKKAASLRGKIKEIKENLKLNQEPINLDEQN